MFLLTLRSIRTLPYGDVFQAFPSINEQLVLSIQVYIIQKLHSSETNNTSDTRITHICMCMCTAACVYCIVIVFVSLIFFFCFISIVSINFPALLLLCCALSANACAAIGFRCSILSICYVNTARGAICRDVIRNQMCCLYHSSYHLPYFVSHFFY